MLLVFSDALVICLALVAAQSLRFADGSPAVASPWQTGVGYTVVSLTLGLLWMGFLSLGSRSPHVTGRGMEEYRVLVLATLQLFGIAAMAALLLHVDLSRGYLAIALPSGLGGLLVSRCAWRYSVVRRRRHGQDRDRLLVVGDVDSARDIATEFARDPLAGYRVVGICTPEGRLAAGDVVTIGDEQIPVVGGQASIADAVGRVGAHTVALASAHRLRPSDVRRLMWSLDALGVDLIVAPGLIDVADQRLRSRPIAGMAMFEVLKPQYSRANSMIKRGFDIAFAIAALIVAFPVMLTTAVAVHLTSPGGIFYRSERIGLDGKPFGMIKFRSMVSDADTLMPSLLDEHGSGPLYFKLAHDPRVTRVGRIIRKYSIDELPQFLNVLRGDMSVVGPRPQVRREVESYDELVSRRLAVRPGLTGLWQVSGRSDLPAEDAVRLDLTYVENWSLVSDVLIIVKTVRTVLVGAGAY